MSFFNRNPKVTIKVIDIRTGQLHHTERVYRDAVPFRRWEITCRSGVLDIA